MVYVSYDAQFLKKSINFELSPRILRLYTDYKNIKWINHTTINLKHRYQI